MKLSELLKRERDTLKKPTLYVQGGWGQKLTKDMKVAFTTNPRWPFNQRPERKAKIMAASEDTIAGDCVCIQKSIFDDLVGVNNQTTAMRKPCPDITIQAIMNQCSNVRDVSYNKEPNVGDFLAYADYSHCGLYLGNNEVAESTHTGSDGFQIRAYAGRGWKWAGKLWFVEDDIEPVEPVEPKGWYVCQCASYTNKDTAISAAKAIKGASVYQGTNGYYAVALGKYSTKSEAAKHLDEAKKQRKDAYVNYFPKERLVYDGSATPTTPTTPTTVYAVQICACRDQKNIKHITGTSVYFVGGWYKQAFAYDSTAEATAHLAEIRKKYGKGCFVTSYKSDALVNKF